MSFKHSTVDLSSPLPSHLHALEMVSKGEGA